MLKLTTHLTIWPSGGVIAHKNVISAKYGTLSHVAVD